VGFYWYCVDGPNRYLVPFNSSYEKILLKKNDTSYEYCGSIKQILSVFE
jgi:hypothetical protein